MFRVTVRVRVRVRASGHVRLQASRSWCTGRGSSCGGAAARTAQSVGAAAGVDVAKYDARSLTASEIASEIRSATVPPRIPATFPSAAAADSSCAVTQPRSVSAAVHAARNAVGSHATARPVSITGRQQARPSSRMADDMNRNGARTKAQATRVTSAVLLVVRSCPYQDRASIPSVNPRPPSASMTESIGKGKGGQWASTSWPKYDVAAAV